MQVPFQIVISVTLCTRKHLTPLGIANGKNYHHVLQSSHPVASAAHHDVASVALLQRSLPLSHPAASAAHHDVASAAFLQRSLLLSHPMSLVDDQAKAMGDLVMLQVLSSRSNHDK